MKETALLNSHLSYAIASLGHRQTLVIADAGLPIKSCKNESCKKIDLALTAGVPSFLQTLQAVAKEMQIEKVTLAQEFQDQPMHDKFIQVIYDIADIQGQSIKIQYISHEDFKTQTHASNAIVRTGECNPYANIILHSGVVF